jgi:molecular chaperone GrpE
MTDKSTEQTGLDPSPSETGAEEDRFEVKWKKRESSTPAPTADVSLKAAGEDDVATLRQQLEDERARANDLRDRWQRAAADLANLRKRTEQDKGDLEKFASMLLVQELLPVLDNFQRALDTIPSNLRMLTWIYGVALIERELQAVLERRGLAPIEATGKPFSAHFHEAISERETSEAESGTVVQEFQKGYTMHGVVIRPSLVEVASAPASPEGAQEETIGEGQSEVEEAAATETIDQE